MLRQLLGGVLLLVVSTAPAFAQTQRGWLDVNFAGAQPAQSAVTYTFSDVLFGEVASAAAVYPDPPRLRGFDIGGGFGVLHWLGVGVQLDRSSWENPVGLGVSIPHPFFFNRSGVDGDVTDRSLERTETALHLSAVALVPTSQAFRVRLFGGPTYFSVKQEMVETIFYNQAASFFSSLNIVEITRWEGADISASAWGYHVGADVAYFFTRYVGVGGVVRYSHGTATIDEPMSVSEVDVDVGHTLFGGGVRFRF